MLPELSSISFISASEILTKVKDVSSVISIDVLKSTDRCSSIRDCCAGDRNSDCCVPLTDCCASGTDNDWFVLRTFFGLANYVVKYSQLMLILKEEVVVDYPYDSTLHFSTQISTVVRTRFNGFFGNDCCTFRAKEGHIGLFANCN